MSSISRNNSPPQYASTLSSDKARMKAALGNGGGNSLLAGLGIVLGIPFPVWLWFYGEKVRARSTLTRV